MGFASFTCAKQATPDFTTGSGNPTIINSNLKVESVSGGLELPTSMAFLNQNDILVLEKDKGTVQRIVNGNMLPEPLLDVDVANKNERGMLGIIVTNEENHIYVFLYFTESIEDGNDDCPGSDYCRPGNEPLGNRLYRYEFVNDHLINPKLMLDLPASPGPSHNGGSLVIGPDNDVYLSIGDVRSESIQNVSSADGRGGILRISKNGQVVGDGIFGNSHPLNLYFAYGIRNSFGLDFDPLTGYLWDTENGPDYGDEINIIEPGFNSGWNKVQGIWDGKEQDPISTNKTILDPENLLLEFDGRSKYSSPEITWAQTIGPTSIKFLTSDKLGKQYQDDIFMGDSHNGNLYHFELDPQRTGLLLGGPLVDKVVDTDSENEGIIFGEGFGGISDLEIGPDGYLYLISIGQGKIFRILPA
ncbi:MAG TPA: PQQ-dependent sugar dehydrogenase [Nitrososphaeraceae archaeon]|nr:PQQ-dependent sugar dehydrogenase [Nitrososphaeraceae archaeon]